MWVFAPCCPVFIPIYKVFALFFLKQLRQQAKLLCSISIEALSEGCYMVWSAAQQLPFISQLVEVVVLFSCRRTRSSDCHTVGGGSFE